MVRYLSIRLILKSLSTACFPIASLSITVFLGNIAWINTLSSSYSEIATQSPTAGKSDLPRAVKCRFPITSASNSLFLFLTLYHSLCSDITLPIPKESSFCSTRLSSRSALYPKSSSVIFFLKCRKCFPKENYKLRHVFNR